MSDPTYEIGKNEKGERYIKCLTCGMASYHPQDIAHLYCGKCHKFHYGPNDLDPGDYAPIHMWFGLTYASWLTIPRVLMEAMPLQWQKDMVRLLNEFNEEFPRWLPEDLSIHLSGKRRGKYASLPRELHEYRHPDRQWLAQQHRSHNHDEMLNETDKDIRGKR